MHLTLPLSGEINTFCEGGRNFLKYELNANRASRRKEKSVIKNSLEISWRLTDYTAYMAVKKSEARNKMLGTFQWSSANIKAYC